MREHTVDDIEITISERVLQHALSAFAAERFTFQRFDYPALGLSAMGGDLRLELGAGSATVVLTLRGAFRLRRFAQFERKESLELRLRARFAVQGGELYLLVDEGSVEAGELEWLGKAGSEILRRLTQQVFHRPLVRLPIQFNVAAAHAESTDESRLALTSAEVRPGALRLALRLDHDTVERPMELTTAGTPPRSRSRAIMLCRRALEERKAGNHSHAASLFFEAALRADPSFETAWLWLATSVGSEGERRYCLERAVAIAPENAAARTALERLSHISAAAPLADSYRPRP